MKFLVDTLILQKNLSTWPAFNTIYLLFGSGLTFWGDTLYIGAPNAFLSLLCGSFSFVRCVFQNGRRT